MLDAGWMDTVPQVEARFEDVGDGGYGDFWTPVVFRKQKSSWIERICDAFECNFDGIQVCDVCCARREHEQKSVFEVNRQRHKQSFINRSLGVCRTDWCS